MTSISSVAAAVAVLLAVGHALVAVVAGRMPLYWFERWAAAYLIGMASLSVLWITVSVFFDLVHPILMVSAFGAAGGAALYYRFRARSHAVEESALVEEPVGSNSRWQNAVLMALITVEFAALTLVSLRGSLGFDGLFNFEMKARLMFEHPLRQLPLGYLSDASRAWSHPQYPLMVPFGELWIYAWLGRIDQTAVKILFPMFFAAVLAFVCGVCRRLAGNQAALATALALGLMPPMTLLPGAASAYADVPLAAAVVGAAAFMFRALSTGESEAAMLAALLLAVASWTKTEGVVLALSIGTLGVLFSRVVHAYGRPSSISFRRSLMWIWLPALAAFPWFLVQLQYGIPAPDLVPFSVANVGANLDRTPAILALFAGELLRPGHWGLVWPACAVATVLLLTNTRGPAAEWFLASVTFVPLILYVLPFMLSSWPDPAEHVRSALPRLLVPIAPVALLLTVVSVSREARA
jgi:hypothetical protein